MLNRAIRPARILQLRRNVLVNPAKRFVTTDAASSHAEKDDVPAVRVWVEQI